MSIKNLIPRTSYEVELDERIGEVLAKNVALIIYGDGGICVVPHVAPTVAAQVHPGAEADGAAFVSRQDIAAWLSVSTRWVERNLCPSAQASPRGRAWYTRNDVEVQLAKLGARRVPASRRISSVDGISPAQRRARRDAATGVSNFESTEHARKVAAVEAALRASVERPPSSTRTRKRREP